MKEILRKIGSKILGTFVGAITGFGAGFIPGYYYFLEGDKGSNYVGGLAYLLTLPFLTIWQMFKGAGEGAIKGLKAALVYPQTLNEQFQVPIRNNEILNELVRLEGTESQILLSSGEQVSFETLLQEKNLSTQKKEKLANRYAYYLDYINLTKSTLSDAPLKDIAHPVVIHIESQTYLCEQEQLKALVEDCQKKHVPVTLNNHVLTKDNLGPFHKTIPENIAKFLTKIRSFFTSLHLINKTLGLKPDASRFDLSLIPEKKPASTQLLTYPSPQEVVTNTAKAEVESNTEAEAKKQQVADSSNPDQLASSNNGLKM